MFAQVRAEDVLARTAQHWSLDGPVPMPAGDWLRCPVCRCADTKYQASTANVRAACEHADISDPFLLWNDDFFAMRPIGSVPVVHRGPVKRVLAYYQRRYGAGRPYAAGMHETAGLLARHGVTEPMSYELHVPMTISKARMLEVLDLGAHIPVLHKRTLYGGYHRIGGTEAEDVKVRHERDKWSRSWTWLSTTPETWVRSAAGAWIRHQFGQPSPYEEVMRGVTSDGR